MWIPRSEQEILAAIESGDLSETSSFDAKSALPKKGKSRDLAVDVAAMANDGGTLLYGIDEDDHGNPAVRTPIQLNGTRERVDQIVQTCISEPPDVEIHAIPAEEAEGKGYLVVAVPSSPRAPHMVTVGKDNRYYGRSATGNMPLTEGEVARLYERRSKWEVDRAALLEEVIERAPIGPDERFSYLHLVARCAVLDEDLLDKARGDEYLVPFLDRLFSAAVSDDVFPRGYGKGYYPDLSGNNSYVSRADGWVASQGLEVDRQGSRNPTHVLEFEVGRDGSGYLFCGRAAEEANSGKLQLFENLVAGLTARFLCVLGGLYAAGTYLGPVDVGIAVTGLKGAVSCTLPQHVIDRHFLQPYDRDQYRRTERFSASSLGDDPRSAARKLVSPLIRAITAEGYDPFSE